MSRLQKIIYNKLTCKVRNNKSAVYKNVQLMNFQ